MTTRGSEGQTAGLECFATWGFDDLRQWGMDRALAFNFERSVRLRPQSLEARRALVSFVIGQPGLSAFEDLLPVLHAMRTPGPTAQGIHRFFASAACVHFGFEISGATVVGKCYLELPAPHPSTIPERGRLQFLGFKWSMNDAAEPVVSRYRLCPVDSWDGVCELMLSGTAIDVRPALSGLLTATAPSVTQVDVPADRPSFQLLEIDDEGSDRRSWDVNVYNHDIALSDITDEFMSVADRFDIQDDDVACWLSRNAAATVGHVAAGIGRDEQPFVTIYHSDLQRG